MTTTVHSEPTLGKAALERRLAGLHDAWRRRDEAAMRTYFADLPDLSLWGTDLFERIVGREDADREFRHWIATCPPWETIESTGRVLRVRDHVAWSADEIEGRWDDGRRSGIERYRMTTVWEAIDGEWRIVHTHLSSPTR